MQGATLIIIKTARQGNGHSNFGCAVDFEFWFAPKRQSDQERWILKQPTFHPTPSDHHHPIPITTPTTKRRGGKAHTRSFCELRCCVCSIGRTRHPAGCLYRQPCTPGVLKRHPGTALPNPVFLNTTNRYRMNQPNTRTHTHTHTHHRAVVLAKVVREAD